MALPRLHSDFERGFGTVGHIFLAVGLRLSALDFGKPLKFRVFGAGHDLNCRSWVQRTAAQIFAKRHKYHVDGRPCFSTISTSWQVFVVSVENYLWH